MSDRWHTILNVRHIPGRRNKKMFINHLRWPIAAGRSLVYSAFRQVKAFFFFSCLLKYNLMDVRYSFTSFCYLLFLLFVFLCTFLFYYPVERRKKMRGFTSIGSLLLLPTAFFVRGLILHTLPRLVSFYRWAFPFSRSPGHAVAARDFHPPFHLSLFKRTFWGVLDS
jgi:hypothetical protein